MSRVLVFSIDSLLSSEVDILAQYPHIGQILRSAARVENLLCPYPTLTYPCHATLQTGCRPERHLITHNEKLYFEPQSSEWYWWAKDLGAPSVLDIAKAHGLSTATVCWPVTGGCAADYCIAEIWAHAENDDPDPLFYKANSPKAAAIYEKNKHRLHWMKTPEFDLFASHCAADIILEHAPALMLVHFSYLDHQRHQLGTHSPALTGAYAFIDRQVGRVTAALKARGLFAETRFVVLGDHGHLPGETIFHINRLLLEKGLLRTDKNGAITEYDLYAFSCALSAQVFAGPCMTEKKARELLASVCEEYPQYIERVFTKEELKERYHIRGSFSFMLEAAPGVVFSNATGPGPLAEKTTGSDYKFSVSTHGHMPEKGDKPPFVASGPGIKAGVTLQKGELVDAAPTILRLAGIEPVNMDGTAFDLLETI